MRWASTFPHRCSKPPHYMTEAERKAPLVFENITVDVGAVSKEEAENEFHIRIGEPVVPDVTFTYDEKHDLMVGKSFDCRLGCAPLSALCVSCREKSWLWMCRCMLFSGRGRTRGSQVTCRTVNPDIAIVFEGCPADDTCVEATWFRRPSKRTDASPRGCPHDHQSAVSALCTGRLPGNLAFRYRMRFAPAEAPTAPTFTCQARAFPPSLSVFRFVMHTPTTEFLPTQITKTV